MPHINTAPGEHDATVSFFILRTDFDKPRLTYHVHRKTGKLSMFGGHVEKGESPWQSALHEITEESGYDHEQLTILQPPVRLRSLTGGVVHPAPVVSTTARFPGDPPHFHSDLLYALVADGPPAGTPAEGESTDIRLYTLDELAEIPSQDIVEMWREVGRYILIDVYGAWEEVPLSEFAG